MTTNDQAAGYGKTKKRPSFPESKLQQACVKWFRYQYPQSKNNLFAIPNGGHRNVITARILKGEGVLAGAADLFLAVPGRRHHGIFIEMKYGNGKQSESQIEFQSAVEKEGYLYKICYNVDDFMILINNNI